MEEENIRKKIICLFICILFIGVSVVPSINGTTVKKMYETVNHSENKCSNYRQDIENSGINEPFLIFGKIHDLKTEGDQIKFTAGTRTVDA